MYKSIGLAAICATSATALFAGGIDRSGQFMSPIFAETGETGSYMEGSLAIASPKAGATGIQDPLTSYQRLGFAYKRDLSDKLSFTFIYDQPFGADVNYAEGLPFVGGKANISSHSFTGIAKYSLNDSFSVYGGLRAFKVGGEIFTVFGGTTPALLDADSDFGLGGVAGVAYEKPEIALRVALTYSSEIDVTLDGTESSISAASPQAPAAFSAPSSFDMTFPDSINLEFQSGVAEDTLVFGSIRHVYWDGFNLTTNASGLPALGATEAEYVSFSGDTTSYTLGVGRRFNDKLSGAVSIGFEEPGNRPSTTALSPTTGYTTISVGGTYAISDATTLRGGVTYGIPGDQQAPSATGLQDFNDNKVVGAGLQISMKF